MRRAGCRSAWLAGLFPAVARADFALPAFHLQIRLLSWWALLLGLVASFFIIRRVFGVSAGRAAKAVGVARLCSTLASLVLTPLAGIAWAVFPGALLERNFGWSAFHPLSWGVSLSVAWVLGCGVDALVYRRGFGFALGRRELAWLALANAICIVPAFASLLWLPLGSAP